MSGPADEAAEAAEAAEPVEPVEPDEETGGAGGIRIGSLSGGAVAAGTGAQAEDRSRRPAGQPPGGATEAAPAASPTPGGISIGEMSGGAVAQGARARSTDASVRFADAAEAERLAAAVRELRGALAAQPRTDEIAVVERELMQLEDEARAGRSADRPRLARLRERLELGQIAAAGGASAAAVAQAIARLLGS